MIFLEKVKSFFYISKKDFLIIFTICILTTFFDLFTKEIVFSIKQSAVYVFPVLNILKVRNFGISFGILNEIPEVSYYIIITCDILIMIYLLHCIQSKNNYNKPLLFIISLGFILGGAFGNLIDRIITGSVRDFIDFHINSNHWPCFNLADCFVCVGVGMWVFCELFSKKIIK